MKTMLRMLLLNLVIIFNYMRYLTVTFFSLLLMVGCKKASSSQFYEIVNDNFIHFVDTTAYRYGTFFPAPNDSATNVGNTQKQWLISVDTTFTKSDILTTSLLNELNNAGLVDFADLLSAPKEEVVSSIDLKKLKKIGRYVLVATKSNEPFRKELVGKISFLEPCIAKNKAIIVISKASSPKAGRAIAFLLEKQQATWGIIKQFELERW